MPFRQAPTSDQLRRDIDSGRTGDKVDFPDPAAAPLGADDEAGGHPPSPAERALAARRVRIDRGPSQRARLPFPAGVGLAAVALFVLALAWRLLGGS